MAERFPSVLNDFLKKIGLQQYCEPLTEMGVYELQDMNISENELISNVNMSQDEAKKLLSNLPKSNQGIQPKKNKKKLNIHYKLFSTFNPPLKCIGPLDTTILCYYDLVNQICDLEQNELGRELTIELYSQEGYPLACKPANYINRITKWHLETLPEILLYAIPRPKLYTDVKLVNEKLPSGNDLITVKDEKKNFSLKIVTDCSKAKISILKTEIQNITGIPIHLFQLKLEENTIINNPQENDQILSTLGIEHDKELTMNIQNEFWTLGSENNCNIELYNATWHGFHNIYGIKMFYSCLFSLSRWFCQPEQIAENTHLKTLGHIRSLSGCPPLIHSLLILFTKENVTLPHRVAITEVLYKLFEAMKPKPSKLKPQQQTFQEVNVIECSNIFWTFFISESSNKQIESYEEFDLVCPNTGYRMIDPVKVTDPKNQPHIVDRSCLKEFKMISSAPNYSRLIVSFNTDLAKVLKSNEIRSYVEDLSPHWEKLAKSFKEFYPLRVRYPLETKDRRSPLHIMIPLNKCNIGIFYDRTKLNNNSIICLDLTNGKKSSHLCDELDRKVRLDPPPCLTEPSYGIIKPKDGLEVLTRYPEEIIIVLLDTSSSMKEMYLENTPKFTSVIEAFTAFSDRTSAYNFKHVIGLVCFSDFPRLIFPLSESFEAFGEQCSDFKSGGSTAIYDAIVFAIEKLNEFSHKNHIALHVPKRILCLTDGEDNRSKIKPSKVTKLLIQNNIIMDTVLLCDQNLYTHRIAKASGGYSFKPCNRRELMQIFENEPMLTLKIRSNKFPLFSCDDEIDLDKLNNLNYDTNPTHVTPDRVNDKGIIPELCLNRAFMQSQIDKSKHKKVTKRILQELAHYQKDPHLFFEVFPNEERIDFWHIIMDGPPETPYSNGSFHMYIEFTDDYPEMPPNIRFVSPIYHCNINSAGRICHAIFDTGYSKGIRVREIFDQLHALLIYPFEDDPLDSVKANELQGNRDEYERKAKEHTEQYSNYLLKNDLRIKILGTDPMEIIKNNGMFTALICPLTRRYFVDPVITKYHITYEKDAIMKHLETHDYDPCSYQKLTKDDPLIPNEAVKMMVGDKEQELLNFSSLNL